MATAVRRLGLQVTLAPEAPFRAELFTFVNSHRAQLAWEGTHAARPPLRASGVTPIYRARLVLLGRILDTGDASLRARRPVIPVIRAVRGRREGRRSRNACALVWDRSGRVSGVGRSGNHDLGRPGVPRHRGLSKGG